MLSVQLVIVRRCVRWYSTRLVRFLASGVLSGVDNWADVCVGVVLIVVDEM